MIRIKALLMPRNTSQEIVTEGALQLMAEQVQGMSVLKNFDTDQPIGKVIKAEVTEKGLEIEAEIEEGATEEEFLRLLAGQKTTPKWGT